MKSFLSSLRLAAWRTAGSRYNASRRLRRREALATFSLASFSVLSIAVAVVQRVYFPVPGTPIDNYLTVVSVVLGIFLLSISLLEAGAAYGLKSDELHRNAEELTAFQRKVAYSLARLEDRPDGSAEIADSLRAEYEAIKAKCRFNHDPIDFKFFLAEHWKSKDEVTIDTPPTMEWYSVSVIRISWHISALWFYSVIWLFVFMILYYAFVFH